MREACGSVARDFGGNVKFDLDAVRIGQEQLPQAGTGHEVFGRDDAVRLETCLDRFIVAGIEGDVVDRPGARGPRRYGDAGLLGMGTVAVPVGDVNAGNLAQVNPVAGEAQRRPRTNSQAERVTVEVARRIDVVGENQVVFELYQRHDRTLSQPDQRANRSRVVAATPTERLAVGCSARSLDGHADFAVGRVPRLRSLEADSGATGMRCGRTR